MNTRVCFGMIAAVLAGLLAGGSARGQSPPTTIEVFHGAQLVYTATFPAADPQPAVVDVYYGVRKAYSVPVPPGAVPVGAGDWLAPPTVAAADARWWYGDARPRPTALARVPGWEAFTAAAGS